MLHILWIIFLVFVGLWLLDLIIGALFWVIGVVILIFSPSKKHR